MYEPKVYLDCFLLNYLFIDIYGDIRTDDRTQGTPVAIRVVDQLGETNPPEVCLTGQSDTFLGTSDYA
jgi:hypothetical protein